MTSINDQDGLPMHIQAQRHSSLSRIEASRYHNKTQTTDPGGGKVTDGGIAVPTVNDQDGILIDYYRQYNGNGSTDDGWPSKDKWISFMDMCVLDTPSLTNYATTEDRQGSTAADGTWKSPATNSTSASTATRKSWICTKPSSSSRPPHSLTTASSLQ